MDRAGRRELARSPANLVRQERLRRVVMKNDSLPSDAYAEKWIADTEPHPPEGLFERWMEFYTA